MLYVAGGGLLAWVLYERVIKPRVIAPAKLLHFTNQLRMYLIGVKFKGDDVIFDLRLQNPDSTALTINALVGEVTVLIPPMGNIPPRRYKLGKAANYQKITIGPTSETRYNLVVKTRFLGLLPWFVDMVQGRVNNQRYLVTGTININGRTWPLNKQLALTV